MRLFSSVSCLLVVLTLAGSVTIQKISIDGSKGLEEEEPIAEEDSFTLKCDLSLDSQEEWIGCTWTHTIEDEYDDNNKELTVVCTSADVSDNGVTCRNRGGTVDSSYASRINMVVSSNQCGVRINKADSRDTGRWECHVMDMGSTKLQSIDIFVSNQSTIRITDPDLYDDDSQTISFDLQDTRPEIEATCTAYGGKPTPEFHWYFQDDRTEIDEEDLNGRTRTGTDAKWGEFISHSITWQPTLEDLCDKYKLDEMICESSKDKYREFNFNLICKVEQEGYYESENDDQTAEVIVEVRDSSSMFTASFALIAAALVLQFKV